MASCFSSLGQLILYCATGSCTVLCTSGCPNELFQTVTRPLFWTIPHSIFHPLVSMFHTLVAAAPTATAPPPNPGAVAVGAVAATGAAATGATGATGAVATAFEGSIFSLYVLIAVFIDVICVVKSLVTLISGCLGRLLQN